MKLNIYNPCKETWEDMSSIGNTHYCASCKQNVTDLTQYSKEEIQHFLKTKANQKFCGKLKYEQLSWTFENSLPEVVLIGHKKHNTLFPLKTLTASFSLLALISCTQTESPKSQIKTLQLDQIDELLFTDVDEEIIVNEISEMPLDENEPHIFGLITEETPPKFPGGMDSIMSFIKQNFVYPEKALRDSIQGRIYISFVVDSLCYITEPKIVRGVHPLLDEEALRLVRLIPRYDTPAILKGKPVNMSYTIPLNFIIK